MQMTSKSRESRAADQAKISASQHPELDDIRGSLARLEQKYDDLLGRVAGITDTQVQATDRITEEIKKLQAELIALRKQ